MTLGLRSRPLRWAVVALLVSLAPGEAGFSQTVGPVVDIPGDAGQFRLFSASGPIPLPHAFAVSFGTNGRTCLTCHVPTDGMSVTPAGVKARFDASGGLDPIFRTNDGSNSPAADVSTVDKRRAAYSMLLSRGVIRIDGAVPPGADFFVQSVDDPYGFATPTRLSLFRRPLPVGNLSFLTAIMWDGRETTGTSPLVDLARQAVDATAGHAQAGPPLPGSAQITIVDLEQTLFAAQSVDAAAGSLTEDGATGGPEALSTQPFVPGINSGSAFSPIVFSLFESWATLPPVDALTGARRTVAAGEKLFNTRNLGTPGFRCSSCHTTPNVGNESTGAFFDTSVSSEARRTPDLPLYTLSCPQTGRVVRTSDPGRALVTGKCVDIGAFKVPMLRGLAARPPFFHDGSAATLHDVVLFYDTLFGANLLPPEVDALVAFLRAL